MEFLPENRRTERRDSYRVFQTWLNERYAMFHQLSREHFIKMLHTPGVTTSNKWPSGSRK